MSKRKPLAFLSGRIEIRQNFVKRIIKNWLERHQNPTSFWLHMVGIPMTIVALGFLPAGMYLVAATLFVLGYVLQFVGHAIEGNDAGELIVVKKLLGKPYVAVVAPNSSHGNAGDQR